MEVVFDAPFGGGRLVEAGDRACRQLRWFSRQYIIVGVISNKNDKTTVKMIPSACDASPQRGASGAALLQNNPPRQVATCVSLHAAMAMSRDGVDIGAA